VERRLKGEGKKKWETLEKELSQFDHLKFKEMMNKIRSQCSAARIACGVHVVKPSREELQERVNEGDRFLAYSVDSVFLNYFSERPNIAFKNKNS